MPVMHEPWLVALSLIVAIQGAYVGLSLAVQIGGDARRAAPLAFRRRGAVARRGDLVDAFRRDAGGAAAFPGRLSRLPDAPLLSRLRARRRRRRLCGRAPAR